MSNDCLKSLAVGTGPTERSIVVRQRAGGAPGLFWLGGFKSDMKGAKAQALDDWARQQGRALTRFDYSGHGESGGRFIDGTIGRWLEESLAVFEACCRGPQVLIGSSMGGWIALLLVRELARRGRLPCPPVHQRVHARLSPRYAGDGRVGPPQVAALVLIAPAVDFTEALMWKRFSPEIKRDIEQKGVWERPSRYGEEPHPITHGLITEGRLHQLLDGMIETGCPVRILQGVQDPDVPWQHAVDLTARLAQDDVVLTLVKDGDHRLSRAEDLERMLAVVAEF
jgi:pimeloyl-ACP methyl ester carboxylesterase